MKLAQPQKLLRVGVPGLPSLARTPGEMQIEQALGSHAS